MNNAAYVRAVIGSFSYAELRSMDIRRVDAVFRASCYEGDRLIFQKRAANGCSPSATFFRINRPPCSMVERMQKVSSSEIGKTGGEFCPVRTAIVCFTLCLSPMTTFPMQSKSTLLRQFLFPR
jgi:hypothetical protein